MAGAFIATPYSSSSYVGSGGGIRTPSAWIVIPLAARRELAEAEEGATASGRERPSCPRVCWTHGAIMPIFV